MASNELKFRCPGCGAKLGTLREYCGQNLECPNCQATITIPAPSLATGDTLGGFRIEHLLAKGSMGEVFLATQLSMDRPVALKVLPRGFTDDADAVELFNNEVRTLARLDHPNIVGAFEAGQEHGSYYLAMSFVDGESVAERLDRETKLAEKEALRIILKVARALEYAWDKFRLLHRDVKPANIMLDRHGEVKLMDLGLAKRFSNEERGQRDQFAYGTPDYMSPEQIRAEKGLDCRADIYSLGATLFHLVTGRPPFKGETATEVTQKHLTEQVEAPHQVNPAVSQGCSQLVLWCMARDPGSRPQTWDAFIQALRRVTHGELPTGEVPRQQLVVNAATRASMSSPSQDAAAEARARGPVKLAIVMGLLVIIAATAVGLWYVQHQSSAPPPPPPKSTPHDPIARGPDSSIFPTPPPALPPDTTPPVPPLPEVDPRLQAATTKYNQALAFEKAHPDDYAGCIRLYSDVAAMPVPSGCELPAQAAQAATRRQAEHKAAKDAVLADLDAKAAPLVAKARWREALDIYGKYAGKLAIDTAEARALKSKELLVKLDEETTKLKADRAAQAKLDEATATLAGLLFRGELEKVKPQADDLRKAPELAPRLAAYDPLATLAVEAAKWRPAILAALVGEIGKELDLKVKNEVGTYTLSVVEPGKIVAKKKIMQGTSVGRIGVTFAFDDLSLDDKLKRLTSTTPAVANLQKGLLYLEGGKSDEAKAAFALVDGPLSGALQKQWDEKYAATAVAPAPADPAADAANAEVPKKGLVLWLRADVGVNTDASGRVRLWKDQSDKGNDAHQANSAGRPMLVADALNGKPVLRFDGANTFLRVDQPMVSGSSEMTMIIVLNLTGGALDFLSRPFGCEGKDPEFCRLDFWGRGESGVPTFSLGTSAGLLVATGTTSHNEGSGPVIISAVYRGGVLRLVDNGRPGPSVSIAGEAKITADSPKFIGASALGAKPFGFYRGEIAEIIIYDSSPTLMSLQQIHQYLAKKYNVVLRPGN